MCSLLKAAFPGAWWWAKSARAARRSRYSLRFGSTIFSGELWIWQTNKPISRPMTRYHQGIIFTLKSPKPTTKQVTRVDGKTLVFAAHGWEEPADWELLTLEVGRGCRIVWHMALGPLTPVIGRSHSLVFWLRPVTVEKTASEMVFTSLRAMPQVTRCCHPNSEMPRWVLVKDKAWSGFTRLCVVLDETVAEWTDGKKRKYCNLTHIC